MISSPFCFLRHSLQSFLRTSSRVKALHVRHGVSSLGPVVELDSSDRLGKLLHYTRSNVNRVLRTDAVPGLRKYRNAHDVWLDWLLADNCKDELDIQLQNELDRTFLQNVNVHWNSSTPQYKRMGHVRSLMTWMLNDECRFYFHIDRTKYNHGSLAQYH